MVWSFPGVSYPVELIYTQTLGFQPDVLLMRSLPQAGVIPIEGTATLTWGATTVTLPNCVVDLGSVNLTQDGRFLLFKTFDRRERWKRAAPISGEYNTIRTGAFLAARQRTFRQLGTLLMTALGEPGADVTALPTNVYPTVSWQCEDVIKAAQTLFEENGYSVALGFGAEVVTVVQLGTGAALSTTDKFVGSDTLDPRLKPRYIRNCFEPSVAQVRLKLEAVGLDTDSVWRTIDTLSFTPAGGWAASAPYSLPNVDSLEANGYVRRAYRVMGFADGTLFPPDGSGALSDIADILPIQNRMLTPESIRPTPSYRPFKVYGRYYKEEDETGEPPIPGGADNAIGAEVIGRRMSFDGENGLVVFEEPIWYVDAGAYSAANLWLECTIQVRHATNFAWKAYEYDKEVSATSVGYHTIRHQQRAETIFTYDSSHVVTGSSNNQATLNALGDAWAVVAAAAYATAASQHVVYCAPQLALRCDGAILQVQHILTCGELGHAVNRTTASRHFEFDRGIPSKMQRVAHLRAVASAASISGIEYKTQRKVNADD
jgi:hypothetical protein